MNRKLRMVCGVAVLALASAQALGADKENAKAKKGGTPRENSNNASPRESAELSALEARLAEQQQQIEELRKTIELQNAVLQRIAGAFSEKALSSASKDQPPAAEVDSATPAPSAPASVDASSPFPSPRLPVAQATAVPESPLQLKIGDSYITPMGFMDITNTFRSTNAGTSLQTNFGSIPYNNTLQGRLTEDKFSAANSRIGFRVDATSHGLRLLGYYEGDFVGGVTGNNTQVSSNSLLYRIRLYWVAVRRGPFEMLAGQSWTMMSPNRRQISALPEDLFYSQVVDVNYVNGLTWGRIPGIRFLYHPSNKVTMGVSLENATQYFGGSGGGGTPTLPAALATTYTSEVDANVINGIASPNVHPDIIAKVAFDPNSHVHLELAGLERTVKLFNPITQRYFTAAGGGGSINANLELFKNFRLVTNNYWSDGGGRYLFGVAPDFIVRAEGSPSLIHCSSTVSGFEAQVKNTQMYAYYGGVYVKRNTAQDANGSPIGYGYAGSPASQNRTIQEGTIGLTQTLWRDGNYGALQMMFQYAYFFRNPWFVAAGAPKNTHQNAIWFNLRYVLPGSAPTIK